jgi:integrase
MRVLYVNHPKINLHHSGFREKKEFRDSISDPDGLEDRHGGLIQKVKSELRLRHYSLRTEEAYVTWIKRFISFHDLEYPRKLDAKDLRGYLDFLAGKRNVAASTQNLALNALAFLYKQVLKRDPGAFGDFARARESRHVPTVLSRDEIERLSEHVDGVYRTMAGLLWGAGLRVMECVRLRVQDIDFNMQRIVVRDGKGAKDRVTMLPIRFTGRFGNSLRSRKRYSTRTGPPKSRECISGIQLSGSFRTRQKNGFGSMFSRPKSSRLTPASGPFGGTTSTRTFFSAASNRLRWTPASPNG